MAHTRTIQSVADETYEGVLSSLKGVEEDIYEAMHLRRANRDNSDMVRVTGDVWLYGRMRVRSLRDRARDTTELSDQQVRVIEARANGILDGTEEL